MLGFPLAPSARQTPLGYVLLTSEPRAEAGGVWAEGEAQPDGSPCTVQLRPAYGGPDFGLYLPRRRGDLLVCCYPGGSPGNGAVEIGPVDTDEDGVPVDVRRHPRDLWLIARPGADLRIRVSGEGAALRIEAPAIVLQTTGQAATSRIYLDGVPWAGVQLATSMGPTIGPPTPGPLAAPALAELAAWELADHAEGVAQELETAAAIAADAARGAV